MYENKKCYKRAIYENEFKDLGLKTHLKHDLERYIGTEIINQCKNLNLDKFEGSQKLDIQINLQCKKDNIGEFPEPMIELRALLETREPVILTTTYVTRKQEATIDSRFYTGEKLSWKERLQALFKGRLYGGSVKLQKIRQ